MNLDHRWTLDHYVGGGMIPAIKPIVTLLGRILRRNHDIQPRGGWDFPGCSAVEPRVIALPARHLDDFEAQLSLAATADSGSVAEIS